MGDVGMIYVYSSKKLYVTNLDETIDDQQLRDAFSTYGEIANVKVMRDENLRSRGFGYVRFRSAEDATVAVTNLNKKMLGSKCIYVTNSRKKRLQGETTQNTTSPSNSTLGPRVFQPGGASYYVSADPQGPSFCSPNQIPVRNNLRWPAQGQIRPGAQHAAAAMANRGARRPPGAITNTGIPAPRVPLTSSMLASYSTFNQKKVLGRHLLPLVQRLVPDEIGMITGMLLKRDNSELLDLLEHPESLKSKVEEAVALLQATCPKQDPGIPN